MRSFGGVSIDIDSTFFIYYVSIFVPQSTVVPYLICNDSGPFKAGTFGTQGPGRLSTLTSVFTQEATMVSGMDFNAPMPLIYLSSQFLLRPCRKLTLWREAMRFDEYVR